MTSHFLFHFILRCFFFLHWITAWMVTPVYAAPTQFQDDFSNGFTQWTIARGSFSLWSISGEKAKATVSTGSTLTEIIPKDEYWNSSWHNIVFQFEYTPLQGSDRNVSFGYQNTNNWYDLHFVGATLYVARVQNGIVTFNVSKPYTLSNGRSYQMRLELEDGRIRLYVDGQKVLDELDWSFNNNFGKISLKATAGASFPTIVQFDNILVTPFISGEIRLNAPLFKQTDPQWKDQEYNHAHVWSPQASTIRRWGCALSSMAMILQYHGLRKLPDGQTLTPATLNDWLKQQADGYLDGGGLNWQAVTRLTRLIHDVYGTVKLEYSRLGGNIELAKTEIAANRPVIMEIPGHFLVADGLSVDRNTVYIKDPAYVFTQFDQHHVAPSSVRKFLPSFTDLSALQISFSVNASVSITDQQGHALPELQTWTEFLQDPIDNSGQKSPTIHYLLLQKPKEGDYHVHVKTFPESTTSALTKRVQIFAYDLEGNVSDLSQALTTIPQSLDFTIHFHTTSPSTITQNMSFHQFRENLLLLKQANLLGTTYVFLQIDRVAALAEQVALSQAGRYISLIQQQADQYKSLMTSVAYQNITSDLALLKKNF